jgi:pilus assembly protein Flp/PilA
MGGSGVFASRVSPAAWMNSTPTCAEFSMDRCSDYMAVCSSQRAGLRQSGYQTIVHLRERARLSAAGLTRRQLQFVKLVPRSVDRSSAGPGGNSTQEHTMAIILKRFVNDESGATAIEYGLIAAGISVAIITVVNTLGSQLKTTFTNISSQLATAGK